jgi:catechol 2,3-dioxygenase-like lactoylglutathione lyase family enzyme
MDRGGLGAQTQRLGGLVEQQSYAREARDEHEGRGVGRTEAADPFELPARLVEVTREQVRRSGEIGDQRVVRIAPRGTPQGREPRVVVAPHGRENEAGEADGVRVIASPCEGPSRERDGHVPLVLGGPRPPSRQRLLVAPREARLGSGEAGVDRERLLEEPPGHGVVVGAHGVEVGQRAQVEVVCREAPRARAARLLDLRLADGGLDGGGDARGDVVLQVEEVSEGTVEARGPELRAGVRLDELRADTDLGRRPAHASLEDVADAELLRRVLHVDLAAAARREARASRDHHDGLEAGQRREDVLGHAVGEVILPGLSGQVREGKHRDRRRRRTRGLGSRRVLAVLRHLEPELIPDPRHGQHRVRAERPPQHGDLGAQVVVDDGRVGPHEVHQLRLGHDPIAVAEEAHEEVEGASSEGHRRVAREHLARARQNRPAAETDAALPRPRAYPRPRRSFTTLQLFSGVPSGQRRRRAPIVRPERAPRGAHNPREEHAVPPTTRPMVPAKFVHVVYRTRRFEEMIRWYLTVFGARVQHRSPALAFLTYDDEHHRFAFANLSVLAPGGAETDRAGAIGVDHVAYTYATVEQLLGNYERLRAQGIEPYWCVHHGITVSMYYADPDGNQMELQVDSYASAAEASAFMEGPAFRDNPIGVEFDPEDWIARIRAGEPAGRFLLRTIHQPVSPLRGSGFAGQPA